MTTDDRTAKRAGLDPDLLKRWTKLVQGGGVTEKNYGEAEDVLTELLDWFTDHEIVDPYALTDAEAQDLSRELREAYDLAGDAEKELYRVKFLGLGADRSAVEVLEDLIEAERQALRETEARA
jgi:hypothetical protein